MTNKEWLEQKSLWTINHLISTICNGLELEDSVKEDLKGSMFANDCKNDIINIAEEYKRRCEDD